MNRGECHGDRLGSSVPIDQVNIHSSQEPDMQPDLIPDRVYMARNLTMRRFPGQAELAREPQGD